MEQSVRASRAAEHNSPLVSAVCECRGGRERVNVSAKCLRFTPQTPSRDLILALCAGWKLAFNRVVVGSTFRISAISSACGRPSPNHTPLPWESVCSGVRQGRPHRMRPEPLRHTRERPQKPVFPIAGPRPRQARAATDKRASRADGVDRTLLFPLNYRSRARRSFIKITYNITNRKVKTR